MPVFQVDAKLRGVVELHILPFGQTLHGVGIRHNLVDDNIVFRGFVDGKGHRCQLHHVVPQVFDAADGQRVINAIADFALHLEHNKGWIVAEANRHRTTQAIIHRIIGCVECCGFIQCLIEGQLEMRHIQHFTGQELGWFVVGNAGTDIDIVEIDLRGVARRELGPEAKIAATTVCIIRPLCLNEINTRIIVARLDHPIAFAVANDFDGNCERGGDGTFHAATDLLLSVGILTEQGDGIAAAAFAEAEEITLGDVLQVSIVGTQPDIRIVVSRRCKSLANPKLPFHGLILADGQGKISCALSFRVELELFAVVNRILFRRS